MQQEKLLSVHDLHVHFTTREGTVRALNGVDMELYRGETLGLVGESGCGKSMTARAIMQMVPFPGKIVKGEVHLYRREESGVRDINITALHPDSPEILDIRGPDIAMIFQEPMTSLSPIHTIGDQIGEAVRLHQDVTKEEARERAIEMLDLVGIPDAKTRVDSYPFEMSGGMRQRAMIAMALSCNPSILIADEPTTALDVTIQAQILELIQRLQQQLNMTVLMITHNLGVVAAMSHRVAVMYLGKIVELASTDDIFHNQSIHIPRPCSSRFRVGEKTGERLYAIKGSIPDPLCRCRMFLPSSLPTVCEGCLRSTGSRPVQVSEGHQVSCLLYSTGTDSTAEGVAGR